IGNASVILEMTAVAQKNDGRFYDAADTYNELFNQTRGGGNIGGRASRGRKKMLEAALSEKNQFPGWDRSDFRSDTLWAVYNELLDADSTGFQFQGLSQYGRWRAVREICETFKTELTQSTTEILRLDGRLYLRVANKVRDEYRKLQSGKSAEGAERRAADVERGREDGMGGEGRRAEDADSERGRERAGGKAVK
ncbi:MAG: hypothetical protein HYT75_02050, partial [Deltaproteobacteria bacterium]|nr:hypothetical protein [Deltaproteobacteria bacterium]